MTGAAVYAAALVVGASLGGVWGLGGSAPSRAADAAVVAVLRGSADAARAYREAGR